MDNPLLEEPLKPEHIKPRRLGHWGTTPGLNLLYAHMNRVIRKFDLNAIFVTGPGHGGPALVASTWLEGTYSERYPNVSQDREGMKRLFRQFSFPGGVPSHCAQASLRSRERFWDIRVPKIDSIFDNSLVPRPSWSPGVPPQHRKLVAATHRSPI